jgi:ABC-type sugar transport system substrate-binding protein
MTPVTRRQYLGVSGGAMLAGLAGCSDFFSTSSGPRSGELNKLGISMYVRGGSWITAFKQAAEFYCKDQGIEVDIVPNQQSAEKQASDIRQFANQGYDGILASVWSTGAIKSAIDFAEKQGVPVFTANADTASSKAKLYVGFSNTAGGRKSGEQMIKALKAQRGDKDKWRVLNIRGPQGNQSANQRSQGFLDAVKQNDKIEVADTINAEFAQDKAKSKVSQWLNSNGNVDGIYSGNLSMGLGVKTAVEQVGKLKKKGEKDHIVLTQMDGSPQVNPLVKQGYIDAAVDQPNYFYMPIAIEYMRQYIENGEDALPKVGKNVPEGDLDIKPHKHKGVNLWKKAIWSPAQIKKQNDHPWFQTNSIVITQENADKPYLWGNIWG